MHSRFAMVAVALLMGYAVAAASTLTITNSVFTNLNADEGAGVHVTGETTVKITGSKFQGVHATSGGAIYIDDDVTLTMDGNTFAEVSADEGSVLYVAAAGGSGEVTIKGNLFALIDGPAEGATVSADVFHFAGVSPVSASANSFFHVAAPLTDNSTVAVNFIETVLCSTDTKSVCATDIDVNVLRVGESLTSTSKDDEGIETVTDVIFSVCESATETKFASTNCTVPTTFVAVNGDIVDNCGTIIANVSTIFDTLVEADCGVKDEDVEDVEDEDIESEESSIKEEENNTSDTPIEPSKDGNDVYIAGAIGCVGALVGALISFSIGRKGGAVQKGSVGGGSELSDLTSVTATNSVEDTFSLEDTSMTSTSVM